MQVSVPEEMPRCAAASQANERGCYCGLWESAPEHLRAEGLAPGYCGFCSICKRPGHMRHFPGTAPVTGAWCDRHYRMIMYLHPLGARGRWLWAGLAVAGLICGALFT